MFNNKLVATIKSDGKIMREHGDTVYLPFGSNYSIFLKNLNVVKAEVRIKIDDQDILGGNSIIIEPSKSVDISRWLLNNDLSKGPKLKFIEKTDSIRETKTETGMDGIVEITYQFEAPPVYGWVYNSHYSYDTIYGSPRSFDASKIKVGGNIMNMNVGATVGSTSVDSALYSSPVFADTPQYNDVYCSATVLNEEGMTVKGDEVKQEFKHAYIGNLESTVHNIVLQLKGNVNEVQIKKPVYVNTKVKCSACEKKQSSTNKFCSGCGNNMKY